MVVVSHLFFFFSDKFREGMTRCESYPPCFGTIYFPTVHFFRGNNYIKLSPKIISYSYIYFTGRKRKLLLHLLRGFS